ncbi:MAG: FAD-dependent oxidoreductase [Microbacteriaceae bacterium]|nr:FAD-dependent oxidoreductase [Burkholderiaceae bacterium]
MRIAIIGAGIAGVTSAYELAADGHDVTVFERRGSVAAEGSFANSGIVAPALASAWAPAPFPRLFTGLPLGWQWRSWRAGRKADAARRARLLHLAAFSRERLQHLRQRLALDYERAEGHLVLLRTAAEAAAVEAGLAVLHNAGLSHRLLDADQCRAVEPGLNPNTALHGGVQLGQAEAGNCRQFAHQLRLEAQRMGVQFRFHTTVRRLQPGAPVQLTHEHTPPEDTPGPSSRLAEPGDTVPAPSGEQQESFDAVIVCAALNAATLLLPVGLKKLALQAMPGVAITAPLRQLEAHPDLGPRAALFDQQRQITIARIGQRVRVTGRDEHALHAVLNDWFPGAMVAGQVQRWAGTYAVLADGLPLLGNSGASGVWLNLAHGDSGWTLACGAARVLAEQIAGLPPEVDVSGLDIARLG